MLSGKGSPSPFPDSDWPRRTLPPAGPRADWLRGRGAPLQAGSGPAPGALRWQVGPGPPAPPRAGVPHASLKFAWGAGASRSPGAGQPRLGHEEPQVPPAKAGRARPLVVRRRHQRGESRRPRASRAPALLPRALPGCRRALLPRLARSAPRSVGPGAPPPSGWGSALAPRPWGPSAPTALGPRGTPSPLLCPRSPSARCFGVGSPSPPQAFLGGSPSPATPGACPAPQGTLSRPRSAGASVGAVPLGPGGCARIQVVRAGDPALPARTPDLV